MFPAETQQRADLARAYKDLEADRGHLSASPAGLERGIAHYNAAFRAYRRLDAYFYLHYAMDTANTAARDEESRLSGEFSQRSAVFLKELAALPANTFEAYAAKRPSLARYARFAAEARREQPHLLSDPEEALLAALEPLATRLPVDVYEKLAQASAPQAADSSEGREKAFRERYAGLAKQRDLYGAALLNLVDTRQALARARHYEDAPSEAYARSGLATPDIRRLLDAVGDAAPVYKQYQALRAARAGGKFWDLKAAPKGEEPPAFTVDALRPLLSAALSPLGPAYARTLERLLDPASGRFDMNPGDHRLPGGFSEGFAGFPSVFYMNRFGGQYNDLRIVAHESTHAVQKQLQNEGGVPAVYFDGPKFLSEAYAIFNELLLAEHLYQQAKDPRHRRFFLEQLLESKGIAIIFVAGAEAAVEQAIYDGVKAGTVRNADDLDALTHSVASRYSMWPPLVPELRMQWMHTRLMYIDPFYSVNYALGGLVALELYRQMKQDPAGFAPRYAALLAGGFPEAADVLLKRAMGIDLHDPALVSRALSALAPRIEDLKALYAQEEDR